MFSASISTHINQCDFDVPLRELGLVHSSIPNGRRLQCRLNASRSILSRWQYRTHDTRTYDTRALGGNISVSRTFLASLLEWLAKLFIPFCLINANHLVAGYCTKERSSRKNHCSCASPKWSRRRTSWYSRDFGRMSRGCSSISDTTWIRSKMCCNPASTP